MNRRDFLKITGAAAGAMTLGGCVPKGTSESRAEAGEMTYRTNPGTGDRVSILGYGCMRWPMKKNSEGGDVVDQEEVNRLVDRAIAGGINYFDTAPVYLQGQSEAATAEALSRYPRESYFIATKLSRMGVPSRENSINMYRQSLKNLRTDYIDYYLLHSVGGGGMKTFNERFVDNGMMEFLMKEREAGRIRNLGFSFHGDIECFGQLMALHDRYHWDFVQIQMNYLDWKHASGRNVNAELLYGMLRERNIPVVIMEPLLGGRLSKVPEHIADRLLSREPESSVASWAFRFAGSPEGVLTVLSGMTYMEHLEDNLGTYSPLRPLTEKDLEFLEETAVLMSEYPTIPCTGCAYCMPCPYGIDIPTIFQHYNKCINEGYIATEGSEDYRKARRAYLVSYSRAVEKVRQADHCIGCGKCVSHCPQNIRIPGQLHRISRYVDNLRKG